MRKIGFIGMGNMAQAMVAGFVASGGVKGTDVFAFAPNQEKLAANCKALGITPCRSLKEMAEASDLIFVACKPYQIEDVLGELGTAIAGKTLVSVAAGWTFDRFRKVLPESTAIQCIMPNTPVSVMSGVFLVEEENDLEPDMRQELIALLEGVGRAVELPSRLMDAGSAVSGCSPAFIQMVIEALGDGAVKNGIQRKQAYELVCLTMIGSAKMLLESGEHPGRLKDNVCSPGGTTIRGVAALEEAGIRSAFIKAVDAVVKG